jgi:hypothetical protein
MKLPIGRLRTKARGASMAMPNCAARASDSATTGVEGDGDDTRPDAGPRTAKHSCARSTDFGLRRRFCDNFRQESEARERVGCRKLQ